MFIDPNKKYAATVEMEKGTKFEIELFADKTPMTVNNLVFLARQGFYYGLTFYRVPFNIFAKTGDPNGDGTGGPSYYFEDEFHPDLRHDASGWLPMANEGVPNTNGSRSYILTFSTTWEGGARTMESFTQSGAGQIGGRTPTSFLDAFNLDGSPKNCADAEAECRTVFGLSPRG